MQRLIILVTLLICFQTIPAQEGSLTVPGSFTNSSFDEFVSRVEAQTPLRFFYRGEWVNDIMVSTSGPEIDIYSLLTGLLEPRGLNFYADRNNYIIIYPGKALLQAIPDFRIKEKADYRVDSTVNALTSSELKYMEGKKKVNLDEFSVGNQKEMKAGGIASLSGRVFDQATGEPMIGATVFVKELEVGAVTDADGHFNLFLRPGKYMLTASSLSMKENSFYVRLYSGGTLSIPMEKEVMSINEVKIVADRNNNITGMGMGYELISARSIKEIPVVMGEKDILKVAQMLPGVQSAGEGSSGLIVRGGSADQNLFYINKLPIYNTSHLFGFFSAFNPDIVSNFALYKSNIPVNYGGRVSSVFDISTRQGNKKNFFGKGGISPVTGHLLLEGPLVKDKSSFVLSYRGTYSDWILSQVDDINIQNSNAHFYDLSATINTEINERNLLKAFGYRSHDRFSLSGTDDYEFSNTGGTLTWKHRFSNAVSGDFSIIHSQYEFRHNNKRNPTEAYTQNYQLNHSELKSDFLYLLGSRHRISYGVTGLLYKLDRGAIVPYNDESRHITINLGVEDAFEGALYLSDEFKITPRFTLLAGLRYSLYTYLGPAQVTKYEQGLPKSRLNILSEESYSQGEIVKLYHGPEPRVALNYILGTNNSAKFSYNRIRQYIFLLSNTIAISPTDQWKLADYHLKPQVADQVSGGYYHNIYKKDLSISAEIYYKWINDVVEYKDGADFISADPIEMSLLQGNQDSYGIELMLKKNTGKFSGWVSYCYSRSLVLVRDELSGEQINSGRPYPSNYDQPHSLNIVTNLKASRRLSFSAVMVYSTGRPVTYPVALYYSGGTQVLHYSGRNEYRIPNYFRVDFSLNYEGNLLAKKWLHSTWMLNIYNLTGRKNAYSVYFEANEGKIQGYKLSIFGQPIITLTWNFKFGNYVSD